MSLASRKINWRMIQKGIEHERKDKRHKRSKNESPFLRFETQTLILENLPHHQKKIAYNFRKDWAQTKGLTAQTSTNEGPGSKIKFLNGRRLKNLRIFQKGIEHERRDKRHKPTRKKALKFDLNFDIGGAGNMELNKPRFTRILGHQITRSDGANNKNFSVLAIVFLRFKPFTVQQRCNIFLRLRSLKTYKRLFPSFNNYLNRNRN